jgi:signal transduction histidine kinase/ligand-binding sensor domain-containing protein
MKGRILLLMLTFIYCCDCHSQQYPFIQYTPKDGLVSNNSRFMFQDSRGLLYVSTQEGMSIYDGFRFINYTAKDGLASNFITDFVEMGEDSIWLMPNARAIQCLVKGRIKNITTSDGFYPVVNKMIKNADGSYYALTDEGLFQFENNHFSRIQLTDKNGRDAGIFFENGMKINNKLFIVTDPHVQYTAGPGRLIVFDPLKKNVAISQSIIIFSVLLSPNGDILVSTDQGLRKIDEAALQKNEVRFCGLPAIYRKIEKCVATSMYTDNLQNLWLCTMDGVLCINRQGNEKIYSVNNGLPVNNMVSVFEDMEQNMWFINEQTGICKLTRPNVEFFQKIKPGFYSNDVFTNTRTDSVWFLDAVSQSLLLRYGEMTKTFKLKKDPSNPPYRHIVMDGNKYFVSDLFDIYQGHVGGKKRMSLTTLDADTNRNANLSFSSLMPDGYGNLIASSEYITVLQPNKKTISYPLGYLADALAITPDKHLWVMTRSSRLFVFRIHPEDPAHYLELLNIYHDELPPISPRSLAVDQKNNVWIGTRDSGLFCLYFKDTTLQSWKQITTRDGLSQNFISFLQVDPDNTVWACSPAGLDRISMRDGKFSIDNITISSNLYQHVVKIQTTKSGEHWAIAESGVIKITPEKNPRVSFQPGIILREIYEGKNRIDPTMALSSFPYNKNNMNFFLAIPSFIDEKQTRFSYLLEGSSNKSWSEPSSQSVINFINLAPGKYKFRAKATLLHQRNALSEISYSFLVLPPWWQTLWFRLSCALIFMIISGWIIRNYYRRKYQQQKIILDKRQAIEKERARIATDMHDDLGAGLSTIRFLGEKVKRNTFSQVTRDDIEKMQATSNDLIDKMNEIIWSMNEDNNSLENLIFYTRSYCMEYCEDNDLLCNIQLPENIPLLAVSGETRRNVFLTVKEILHNVAKHACAKNVDVVIETTECLCIVIKDNGTGFLKNHKTPGGNGLVNMRRRIEATGGNMQIQHEHGVTIRIKVPLKED